MTSKRKPYEMHAKEYELVAIQMMDRFRHPPVEIARQRSGYYDWLDQPGAPMPQVITSSSLKQII